MVTLYIRRTRDAFVPDCHLSVLYARLLCVETFSNANIYDIEQLGNKVLFRKGSTEYGQILSKRRNELNISPEGMAHKIGITPQKYKRLESGASKISEEIFNSYCGILKITAPPPNPVVIV